VLRLGHVPQRRQLVHQRGALRRWEGAEHPDVVQHVVVVVEPEQQGAHHVTGLVPAEPGHHAVGGAGVLDLEHGPLARLVRRVGRLGDQPVQPGALEEVEPLRGDVGVLGDRGEVHALVGPHNLLQRVAPLPVRHVEQHGVVDRQQVERDERGRALMREQLDARRRRVHPLGERVEAEPAAADHHQLAVDYATSG
jgi:hypothetical protein